MSTFTEDLEELWTDLVAEFGIAGGLSFNDQTGIDCVLTPFSTKYPMSAGPYNENIDTEIDCLRADADGRGLLNAVRNNARPKVTVTRDGIARVFQVFELQDDDTADPCIKLLSKLMS